VSARTRTVLPLAALAALALASAPALAGGPVAGKLAADGAGRAVYEGTGVSLGWAMGRRAQLRVQGDAVLSVGGRNYGGRGNRVTWVSGRWMVTGYRPGSRFRVELRAPRLSFSAAGSGWVRLEGAGTYWTDVTPQAAWTRSPVELSQPVRANTRRGNRDVVLLQSLRESPAPPVPEAAR
jgi:hypothetical protein